MATIKRDTSKSDQIVQRFRQSTFKSKRKRQRFPVTLETTVEELFPLFCPTREADWVPGWDCELVYTDSGYAEEDCIFKTDKSNAVGDGVWVFVGFEANRYVEFVRVREDMVSHARVTVTDNKDGTVTAAWDVVNTGLTEKGNEEIDKMVEEGDPHGGALDKILDHYLKKGKAIKQTSHMGVIAQHAQHVKKALNM